MKVFICSVLVCASFVSVIIIFTFLLLRMLMPKKRCSYFVCVPCDEKTKDLRSIAYSARLKLNLCGECEKCVLVIVDNGICDAELEDALKLCGETEGITVVKKEDLKDFINGRF